ncbi:hypothetical protein NOVOSPHI9U_10473 [Novosphingobium sp. 9U]|nr:hypothetical protein NOVOSPHI9U_10473 [Novosphingobium sp. 9U]
MLHRSSDQPGLSGPKQTRLGPKALARSPYSVLLRVGFAMPLAVTGSAVRSCRTLSPLPWLRRDSAVCSLWHFP